jgi:4-hydroxy-tetrahydrodipicolinate synthase
VSPPTIDRDWVRSSLSGPVTSVHPCFHEDGSLDFDGLRTEIDHNVAAGSGTMLLTYGDSLHSLITDAEVAEVLKVVVEHTARRAMVVAADRQWWTGKEIEFADFALAAGADVLMVLPPHWGGSVTHDSLVEHYRAVSEHAPVMLVTALFAAQQALGLRVIETLVDQVPNIVAIKDDVLGPFARKMALLTHERWAVISGGLKQNHLDIHPYGCDGYMSDYLHFMPEVPKAYWRRIEARDLVGAAQLIATYENPWVEFGEGLSGGFDAMYHGAQEVFGIAGRWRRQPYGSPSAAEMEQLRAFFASLPSIAEFERTQPIPTATGERPPPFAGSSLRSQARAGAPTTAT